MLQLLDGTVLVRKLSLVSKPQQCISKSGILGVAANLSTHVSHSDVFVNVQQPLFDLWPHAVGDIHPGTGRTLLTTVLKCRANSPLHHALHIR